MGWMSPNELKAEPKRWLEVPHEFHEVLTRLMGKLYPGEDWAATLKNAHVHCYLCETGKPKVGINRATLEPMLIVGHVGDPPVAYMEQPKTEV